MTHPRSALALALGQLGVAALLFSSAGVASRLAPAGISVATFGVARLLVGGIALAALSRSARLTGLLDWRPGLLLALAAVAMAVFQWCYFAAVADGGAGVATLVSAAAAPVFADAAAALRERQVSRRRAAGVGLTTLAIACAARFGDTDVRPLALALLAGLAYAGYAAAAAGLGRAPHGGGLRSTGVSLVLAGILLLPAVSGDVAPVVSWSGAATLAYLGLAATALAYALFASSLGTVSTGAALLMLLVQPIVAVLASRLVLGEPVNAGMLAAVAFLVLALGTRALEFRCSSHARSIA